MVKQFFILYESFQHRPILEPRCWVTTLLIIAQVTYVGQVGSRDFASLYSRIQLSLQLTSSRSETTEAVDCRYVRPAKIEVLQRR
jgi:hypothetical protein